MTASRRFDPLTSSLAMRIVEVGRNQEDKGETGGEEDCMAPSLDLSKEDGAARREKVEEDRAPARGSDMVLSERLSSMKGTLRTQTIDRDALSATGLQRLRMKQRMSERRIHMDIRDER